MTTLDALLQDVVENPDDDLPRLVYADWLEEFGDDPLRAELIRVQIELEKVRRYNRKFSADSADFIASVTRADCLIKREIEILQTMIPHEGLSDWRTMASYLWSPKTLTLHNNCRWEFHRGFISTVTMPLNYWLVNGRFLVDEQPIVRVMVSDKEPNVGQVTNVAVRGAEWYGPVPSIELPDWIVNQAERHSLPIHVFRSLRGDRRYDAKWYNSKDVAIDDLSNVLLQMAKESR